MDGIRIRGARLVYRQREAVPIGRTGFAVRTFDLKPGRFIDGDIIEFPEAAVTVTENGATFSICFRVGHGGSTLTPVARGSWL